MGALGKIIGGTLILGSLYFGKGCVGDIYKNHVWDRDVTKYVEVANGAVTAGKKEGIISMEESLEQAYDHASRWKGKNLAIKWATATSEVDSLRSLLQMAARRSHEIGQLEQALYMGVLPNDAPAWIKETVDALYTDKDSSKLDKRITYSEKGQTIASSYEALNDVIAGGSRVSGDASTEDRSLIFILDEAGGIKSIVRGEGNDYKKAAALVYISLIKSNMGFLDEAIADLKKAYNTIKNYPDDKNLSIVRNTVTMNQGTLEKLLLGAIDKFEEVNKTDPSLKYSAGWWDRVAKLGESIGGDETPCLTDISKHIGGRYSDRALLAGLWCFLLGGLGLGKLYVTRDGY